MRLDLRFVEKYSRMYDEQNLKENKLESRIRRDVLRLVKRNPPSLNMRTLLDMTEWKVTGFAKKVTRDIRGNSIGFIREVTRVSLTTRNEELRLMSLTLLNGVGIRFASAILAFCFPRRYTVMDINAWRALQDFGKIKEDIKDDYDNYREYNEVCRSHAKRLRVPLRKLDKALWKYAEEEL